MSIPPGQSCAWRQDRHLQRSFIDHRIGDVEDYIAGKHYLEQNPVTRGIVQHASDYPWSSASLALPTDGRPQRLKPRSINNLYGTTEVVP